MKEIRILMQQLRNYPSNFFVYPAKETENEELKDGLIVCDVHGEEQGFIETGGDSNKVIVQ